MRRRGHHTCLSFLSLSPPPRLPTPHTPQTTSVHRRRRAEKLRPPVCVTAFRRLGKQHRNRNRNRNLLPLPSQTSTRPDQPRQHTRPASFARSALALQGGAQNRDAQRHQYVGGWEGVAPVCRCVRQTAARKGRGGKGAFHPKTYWLSSRGGPAHRHLSTLSAWGGVRCLPVRRGRDVGRERAAREGGASGRRERAVREEGGGRRDDKTDDDSHAR